MEQEEYKSLYRRAAEQGVPMGMVLTVLAVSVILADVQPWLSWVALALVVSMPFYTWRLMRQYFVEEQGFPNFSSLWMMGILTFIYGSLLAGLASWAVMTWVRPNYIYDTMQQMIALYSSNPSEDAQLLVDVLRSMIAQGKMPRPIEMVMTAFWLTSFAGSMLSLVVAIVVPRVPLPQKKSEN